MSKVDTAHIGPEGTGGTVRRRGFFIWSSGGNVRVAPSGGIALIGKSPQAADFQREPAAGLPAHPSIHDPE
jgi:hypothetical protein